MYDIQLYDTRLYTAGLYQQTAEEQYSSVISHAHPTWHTLRLQGPQCQYISALDRNRTTVYRAVRSGYTGIQAYTAPQL